MIVATSGVARGEGAKAGVNAEPEANGRSWRLEYTTLSPGLALHVAGETDDGVSFRLPEAPKSEGYVRVCASTGCKVQFAPGRYRFRIFYGDGVTTAKPSITQLESYLMIPVSGPRLVDVSQNLGLHAVYKKHETMRFAALLTGVTVPLIGVMWGVIGLLVHKPEHAVIGGSVLAVGIGGAYLLNVPDTMELRVTRGGGP